MHGIVSALTMCKFEATNPWHDQMVLCKILQTLDACLEGPSGRLLRDVDVCAIFQAVYRIGFDTQVVAELSGALSPRSRHSHCSSLVERFVPVECATKRKRYRGAAASHPLCQLCLLGRSQSLQCSRGVH
jgi:hypothetical protein